MSELGHFRDSVILKGVRRRDDSMHPGNSLAKSPMSGAPHSPPGATPSAMENGEEMDEPSTPKASKQVDHYGFTFSVSEADDH